MQYTINLSQKSGNTLFRPFQFKLKPPRSEIMVKCPHNTHPSARPVRSLGSRLSRWSCLIAFWVAWTRLNGTPTIDLDCLVSCPQVLFPTVAVVVHWSRRATPANEVKWSGKWDHWHTGWVDLSAGAGVNKQSQPCKCFLSQGKGHWNERGYVCHAMQLGLGSATLLQLAFLGESDPSFRWVKFPLGQQSVQKYNSNKKPYVSLPSSSLNAIT